MSNRPVPNEPVSWWHWCRACGNLWSPGSCKHDLTYPFPDPDAAEAAGKLGGSDAVWAIERQLYEEHREAVREAFRVAIRPMVMATGRIPIPTQLRAKQKRKKRTKR